MDKRLQELEKKDFRHELLLMWNKITVDKTPLSFMRFGDGEGFLMRGAEIHAESTLDGWSAPEGSTKIRTDLLVALQLTGPEIYIGISDLTLFPGEMVWALKQCRQSTKFITFACLFNNANYSTFRSLLSNLSEPAVIMSGEGTTKANLGRLKVKEYFPLPNDCVNYWEVHKEALTSQVDQLVERHSNTLFLVAGGPLAKVLVAHMWKKNPSNRYIDVGSAIDEILYERTSRPYHKSSTQYSTFSLEAYYSGKKHELEK